MPTIYCASVQPLQVSTKILSYLSSFFIFHFCQHLNKGLLITRHTLSQQHTIHTLLLCGEVVFLSDTKSGISFLARWSERFVCAFFDFHRVCTTLSKVFPSWTLLPPCLLCDMKGEMCDLTSLCVSKVVKGFARFGAC